MTALLTEVCGRCGNLKSVCSDPEMAWYPQRTMCYATAADEMAWRKARLLYKSPDAKSAASHPLDGMSIHVSIDDLTPDDDFLDTQEEAAMRAAIAASSAQPFVGIPDETNDE